MHLQRGTGQAVEALGDAGQIGPPRFGDADTARLAPEQVQPQQLLQRLDLLAHRPRGHAEFGPRLDERPVAGGGLEGAERVERRQSAQGSPLGLENLGHRIITSGLHPA